MAPDTSEPGTPSSIQSAATAVDSLGSMSPRVADREPPNINEPLPGWPEVANIIAAKSEFEAFPSFTDLNIKSLLYYQAELIFLRNKLHKAEYKDFYEGINGNAKASKFARSVESILRCRNSSLESEQWKLIEEIRVVLKKYSKSVWNIRLEDY
jgi:hypothetical protein